MRLAWTLAALPILGAISPAHAEPPPMSGETLAVDAGSSRRGVAEDYIVAPSGGEVTGQMRFLTADGGMFGAAPVKFSDVALFGLSGRWSLVSKLEVNAHVELLPKQPSETDEKTWQSVGVGVRSPLASNTVALAVDGSGGHLLSHDGAWYRTALALQIRKPVHEILTFEVTAGADTTALVRDDHDGGFLTELGATGSALIRAPNGSCAGWVGMAYAVPVSTRGYDPTSDAPLDPQPRLDFRIGGVLSFADNWDVFAEYLVIDRGDRGNAASELPILDGGFDQRQILLGVTRHIKGGHESHDNTNYDVALAR